MNRFKPHAQAPDYCAHCKLPFRQHRAEACPELLTREQAISEFRALIARYGLCWTAAVPREACDRMAAVNRVLTEKDRREAIR